MNKIISNKNGIIISKNDNKEYNSEIYIQNNNINLKNKCDLNIFKYFLLFKQDFCEIIEFKKINENEVIMLFVFKHFFCDIGFPHYYFYKKITFEKINNDTIIFHLTNMNSELPENVPPEIEDFLLDVIDITFIFKDKNNINCNIFIKVNDFLEVHNFLEKIACLILNKIIIILKYILENYHNLNNMNDNKL